MDSRELIGTPWPAYDVETLPWRQQIRGGTRADRTLSSVDAPIPPMVAELDYLPPATTTVVSEEALLAHPTMTAAEIEARSGSSTPAAYLAIDQLAEAGFIEEITGRKRDRVWVASELLAELDDLDRRIHVAMTA